MWSHILLFVCQGKCVIQFLFCLSYVSLSNGQSILANFLFFVFLICCFAICVFSLSFRFCCFFLHQIAFENVQGLKNRRCAMCRTEFPIEFLERPELLLPIGSSPSSSTSDQSEYKWFYKGRNGSLQFYIFIFEYSFDLILRKCALSSSSNGNNVLSYRLVAI